MTLDLGYLSRIVPSFSRSISAENPCGEAGGGARAAVGTGRAAARELGQGWKIAPAVAVEPGETRILADIEGPGTIQHVWMGVNGNSQTTVVRIVWDGSEVASVDCPVGHFFACGWGGVEPVSSLAVCMNPRNGFNCYWEMPFRVSCRISVENVGIEPIGLYYQIDYARQTVPEDVGRFHARFRRSGSGLEGNTHTVLDIARCGGQYVGTCLFWQPGMAGDRRIEFLVDEGRPGESCRISGLAGYFGCSESAVPVSGVPDLREFSTPYSGLARATGPEGAVSPIVGFTLYRWHVMDPIRFTTGIRVALASMNLSGKELSSVAYWYQRP